MKPFWDFGTLCFYLILALLGMICMYNTNKCKSKGANVFLLRTPAAYIWLIVWTIFAVFRLVRPGIGGSDAVDYIYNFTHCNDPSFGSIDGHDTSDLLFLWINQTLRHISSDYHLFFFIIYFFIAWVFVVFLKEFSKKEFSIVPFILVFYLYLRGFSSIRSNMAISFILLGLVSLTNSKVKTAYFLILCSALTHKMGILFGLVIPFCQIYMNRKINLFRLSCLLIVVYAGCIYLRDIFIDFASEVDLGGAYKAYAEIAREEGVVKWINDFGQMLMAIVFIFMSGRIKKYIANCQSEKDRKVLNILWLICIFDILMIPVNQLMGIYRGYEFFYLARLSMWSFLLYLISINKSVTFKSFTSFMAFFLFVTWFVYRLSRTYEDTCLMPYIFEPFYSGI